MRKIYCSLLIVILISIISPTVFATNNPNQLLQAAPNHFYYPDKDAVVWREEQTFDYSTEPYQEYHYRAIKIFNKKGAQDYSQVAIEFHPRWHEFELEKVQVITPSGELVKISGEQITEEEVSYTPNSNLYQSKRRKIISVPDLKPGSILIYAYQKQIKKLLIPQEIQIRSQLDSQESKVVLKLPQDREINTKVSPLNELKGPDISREDSIKKYKWTGYKAEAELLISTLDSWEQLSKWYTNSIEEQGQLDSDLQAKVENLTSDLETTEAKIKALYNYVATNIRYLDHEFGVNGYQPLEVNKIDQQQYAVAKDKVYLLVALLQEIGVQADPVVLNKNNNFDSRVVVADFNRILVYLPNQNIYLAPTTGFIRYSNLPLDYQGKRMLNLRTGYIGKLPIASKESNREQVQAVIDLKESGAADIELKLQARGIYDFIAKAMFGSLHQVGQEEMMLKIINKYFANSKIEQMDIDGVNDLKELAELNLQFRTMDYYQQNQDQISIKAIKMPISLLLSIIDTKNTLPSKIERELVINLPAEYEVIELPKNKEFINRSGELNISYEQKDSQIVVDFKYQFNKLAGVQRVSWVYIEDLLAQFEAVQEQEILLRSKATSSAR
ncbi:MAG: DUF3857 domain-containing protein [Bacillota bacterium]